MSRGKIERPPSLDYEIMVAAAKCDAAHLGHAQPPPLGSVIERQLFEKDDAMRDGMKLKILGMRGQVVEQEHSALPARKEMLEGEDLTTVAQRVLRQEPHFRQTVEHHADGLDSAEPARRSTWWFRRAPFQRGGTG